MTGTKMFVLSAVALAFLASAPISDPIRGQKESRIGIAYEPSDNIEHTALRTILKEHRILEQFREYLAMLKLPRELKLTFSGCDGEADAWYEQARHQVTICYEYIEELRRKAPKETTEDGVTPEDAVIGPVMEVVLHETAHAVFHMLRLPILGKEEDAADQFAAIMLLQMGQETARRTIAATAHMYWREASENEPDHSDFASSHSPPIQRFYQLVCTAYGWDANLFGYVREKYLDPERADECADEVQTLKASFSKLIGPHLDPKIQNAIEISSWIPVARKMLHGQ
jgi:hypothetical protein